MTNRQQLTCALNFFNFSGRDRRSRDRFLAAGEEDKDVLTLCEKRIYLFVLIFWDAVQAGLKLTISLSLLLQNKTPRCNEIFWLVVFSPYSVVSLRDTLSETILFLHVLLKCFPIKVILYLPCHNVLLHCCKSLLFLCKDKACVNTDTIVLELWPHPHRGLWDAFSFRPACTSSSVPCLPLPLVFSLLPILLGLDQWLFLKLWKGLLIVVLFCYL